MKKPRFLTIKQVKRIHEKELCEFGGEFGIRDEKLLASAVFMPRAGMAGEYFHSDLFEMAAAYLYHIVQNHPFVDGNKRAGLAVAVSFLALNGYRFNCTDAQLTTMVLNVAEGKCSKEQASDFIRIYTAPKK